MTMRISQLQNRITEVLDREFPRVSLEEAELVESPRSGRRMRLQVAEVRGDGSVASLDIEVPEHLARFVRNAPRGTVVKVHGSLVTTTGATRPTIEPSFLAVQRNRIGPMEQRRREVERMIDEERLARGEKPSDVLSTARRILVLTPPGAAGREDFEHLVRGIRDVDISYDDILTQGPGAPSSIARAVRTATGYDAVFIVRGGGDRLALRAFDDEAVVRAIADSPVPVMLAVGHVRDSDLLAHRVATVAYATPSSAAAELKKAAYRRSWASPGRASAQRTPSAGRSTPDLSGRLATAEARVSELIQERHRWEEAYQYSVSQIGAAAERRVRRRAAEIAAAAWFLTVLAFALAPTSTGAIFIAVAGGAWGLWLWNGRRRMRKPLAARRRNRMQPLDGFAWIRLGVDARSPRQFRRLFSHPSAE